MTTKPALKRFFALWISLLISSVMLGASTIDRTIAKINDDILTESDLAEVVADASGDFNPLKRTGYEGATSVTVKSMLDRSLLLQEARRMKITPKDDELHRQVETMVREIRSNFSTESEFHHALAAERLSLDQLKRELLEKTKTDYMVFHVVNSQFSVSDDEVAQYKQEQALAGENVMSFRLRRLGIPVKGKSGGEAACREARSLVARIITEGISFEEGVRLYSQVPGADADGGDMGYMSVDKLSSDVRGAVENLEVGQASPPVIAGGYANIFYLEGKRGAQSALREKRFFEARDGLLERLRKKAILQVFDSRLLKILPEVYRGALTGSGAGNNDLSELTAAESSAPAPSNAQQPEPLKETPGPQYQSQGQQQQGYYTNQSHMQAEPTPRQRRFPSLFGRRQ